MKKRMLLVIAVVLSASASFACGAPKPAVDPTQGSLGASSSVMTAGSTAPFASYVITGSMNISAAKVSFQNGAVGTIATTTGTGFTSNPYAAGAAFQGGAFANIAQSFGPPVATPGGPAGPSIP